MRFGHPLLRLSILCGILGAAPLPSPGIALAQSTPIELDYGFRTPDGLDLAAKLTLPSPPTGRYPVVVFIGGQNPADSDYVTTLPNAQTQEILPVRELAKRCSDAGLAFVRYQKRGANDPGGRTNPDGKTGQLHNLTSDAKALLAKLKQDPRIDGHHVALVGHDEGTAIATWVAGRDPDVRAFGFMGLMRRNLHDIERDRVLEAPATALFERFDVSPKEGFIDEHEMSVAQNLFTDWQKYDTDKDGRLSRPEVVKSYENRFTSLERALKAAKSSEQLVFSHPAGWWKEHFAHQTPGDAWKRIRTPVLVLQGSRDTVTPYATEALPFEQQLAAQHHPDHRLIALEGLDHELRDASGTSHADEAFKRLAPWLSAHLKGKR